jgi:toxin HigB-1
MIQSFGSKETEKIWNGVKSQKLPDIIQHVARRKLRMLNNSLNLNDLIIPPSNNLKKLIGELKDIIAFASMINGELFFIGKMGIHLMSK